MKSAVRAPTARKYPIGIIIGSLVLFLCGGLIYSRQEAASLREALKRATEHSAALATNAAWHLAGAGSRVEEPKPTFIAFEEEGAEGLGSEDLLEGPDFNTTGAKYLDEVDLEDALASLSGCQDFECVAKAHEAINGRTRFNLPHFFLIGWQKCATTSINHHFRRHPQYLQSVTKEAHYWTICQYGWAQKMCRAKSVEDYLNRFLRIKDAAAMKLEAVTVDASVDTAWKGEPLARKIHETFPWVKIVIMMREPISRMVSWTRMWTQKGHRGKGCADKKSFFHCLRPHLGPRSFTGHYAEALEGWLRTFPPEQIHVIQFEELIENNEEILRRLKAFLGMDTNLPETKELRNVNSRGTSSAGYTMKLKQYKALVDMVKADTERVASLLGEYRLADEKQWMQRWSSVWERMLATCDDKNECTIN